ncbi:hypothetical protein EV360DRAFT_85293 [Lentinula raphanica]|nr:hypothetical protein EV360DRAFT_85293 [Lentinula raphanica]
MMRVRFVFSCLLLGLIAAVCAAPVPIRRSTDIKVSITFVHNPASGNESLDKDRLLGWAQSVIDQQKSTLGLPDGVKILAKDVPQSQQDRIHFSVEGGTVCSITQACDVEFGEGSGSSSKDTLSATITQRSKQLFSGPVQLQNYCLLLGLIAAVCAAPAPLRRDSYVKASVTYVHNPAAGDVPLDEDRLLGWSQSVIDQQDLRETVFGFSEDVKILAADIPQYQQETIHFTVSGGACFVTEACDVVLSGSSSEDTLPVIVSKNVMRQDSFLEFTTLLRTQESNWMFLRLI